MCDCISHRICVRDILTTLFLSFIFWLNSRLGHFVWYNFWYARGSYLNTVEQPIITERRHYYEDWLARSGLPPQEDAPYALERDLGLYPRTASPPDSCYALMGGEKLERTQAPNIGYFLNIAVGERQRISDGQY
jgi:hypothetical protein